MAKTTLSSIQYKDNGYSTTAKSLSSIKNSFALPKIDKVTINTGVGKFENKDIEEVAGNLLKLTAQKPRYVASKKSIAGFKLRAGKVVGLQVTLRGQKMYDFLLNLVYIALPRSRDFKGVKANAFDKNKKTYTIGIPSASIFPEVGYDVARDFGLQVNITFKEDSEDNQKLLEALQIPFSKQQS